MTDNEYDPRYVRECRRKAKLEKVKYTLYWVIPLLILLVLTTTMVYYLSVKTAWQKFSVQLAVDVLYSESENSMRAVYGDEDVRVSFNNCKNLYNMILDADAAGSIFGGRGDEAIHIDFGNGNRIDIINIDGDRCFLKYYGDQNYNFKIGVQGAFSKFVRITSLEGANYSNLPWAESEPID